ncbi:MAG TPA: hypothetical protein PKA63_04785 [Oligoflexia bacterium]|mgnify:CR=1 FL=1|nr:hypothetical protein [Oligoflexia bacterium]HMP47966.1 hypothetical protein [Oligoflexia bacterium]
MIDSNKQIKVWKDDINQKSSDNPSKNNDADVDSRSTIIGKSDFDIVSFLEDNWQRLAFTVVLLAALIWFGNEYRSAQLLRQEEASLAYSNTIDLFKKVQSLKQSDAVSEDGSVDNDLTDQIGRLLDESERLDKEYKDTTYGELSHLLRGSLSPDSQSLIDIRGSTSKNELGFDSKVILVRELKLLIEGRKLAFSKSEKDRESGIEILKTLIKEGHVYHVEGAMSLAVAYLGSGILAGEKKLNTPLYAEILVKNGFFTILDELVLRSPQVENIVKSELGHLGVHYEAYSNNES